MKPPRKPAELSPSRAPLANPADWRLRLTVDARKPAPTRLPAGLSEPTLLRAYANRASKLGSLGVPLPWGVFA